MKQNDLITHSEISQTIHGINQTNEIPVQNSNKNIETPTIPDISK